MFPVVLGSKFQWYKLVSAVENSLELTAGLSVDGGGVELSSIVIARSVANVMKNINNNNVRLDNFIFNTITTDVNSYCISRYNLL